jgi:predicted nucleic acid-binding protein
MRPAALVDTGFLLALLDRSDEWHQPCARLLKNSPLPLLTSEAVLTELFHLVVTRRVEFNTTWRFLRSSAIVLASISTTEFPQLQELMVRYDDRPMDFADATLVRHPNSPKH